MNQVLKRAIWSDADAARFGKEVPELLLGPAERPFAE